METPTIHTNGTPKFEIKEVKRVRFSPLGGWIRHETCYELTRDGKGFNEFDTLEEAERQMKLFIECDHLFPKKNK